MDKHINILRDTALFLENKNNQLALDLMTLALMYRPSGTLISAKCRQLSQLLEPSENLLDSVFKSLSIVKNSDYFYPLLDAFLYFDPNNKTPSLSDSEPISFYNDFNFNKAISLNVDDEFDVIPFGHRCTSAVVCHHANLIDESLPFDWTIPLNPKRIKKVLEEDFEDFVPIIKEEGRVVNKYGIGLAHFRGGESTQNDIDIYTLRVKRFRKIIASPKHKYFIYVNEDYLYNPHYRSKSFLKGNFEQMLALEAYMKDKYPHFKFNILYFDFIRHITPSDSSIIPFVIKSSKHYGTDPKTSGYHSFRMYVARILAGLFKTDFTGEIDLIELFKK